MPILFGTIASSNQQARADSGAMFPLGMVQVGSAGAANVEFTSIPSTFKHLQIRLIARNTENDTGAGADLRMQLNGDTGSNYASHNLRGDGASATATAASSQAQMRLSVTIRNGRTASAFNAGVIDILDYTSTNKNTTVRSIDGYDSNGAGQIYFSSGLYNSTNAITSIKLFADAFNFAQYSTFALYGIKGA
jgi:hypothetical protein